MQSNAGAKKMSALETHYRDKVDRVEKDNAALRSKLDKMETENAGLKKAVYELSLRYNLFRPGEPVKPFDLDTVGTDIPTELLKMIEKTQTDAVVSAAAPKGKSDARKFTYKYHFPRHTGAVYSVRFSPSGRLLASSSYDKTVRVWDLEKQKELFVGEKHTQPVVDVQWGKGDSILASASFDHSVVVWDIETAKPTYDARLDGLVLSVAINPADDNLLYVGSSTKKLYVVDRRVGAPVSTLHHESMINSIYVFRDGSHTLTGDSSGGISTWNVGSQRIVDQFYNEEAHKPISCISVSSMSDRDDEGRYLAVNSYDNVLRVYDRGSSSKPKLAHSELFLSRPSPYASPEKLISRCLDQKGGRKDGTPSDAAETDEPSVSEGKRTVHDSLLLATGSGDQACYVFDVGGSQPELVQRLDEHTDRVYAVDFHPTDAILATASADYSIRIFTAKSKKNGIPFAMAARLTCKVSIEVEGSKAGATTSVTMILGGSSTGKPSLHIVAPAYKRSYPLTAAQLFIRFAHSGKATIGITQPKPVKVMVVEAQPKELLDFLDACKPCVESNAKLAPVDLQAISAPTLGKRKAVGDENAGTSKKVASPTEGKLERSLSKAELLNAKLEHLSEEQRRAVKLALDGYSMFITGCAGTGKSFLVKEIISLLPISTTFVTATTGVAACNVGGQTIHSFAGVGNGEKPLEELKGRCASGEAGRRWRSAHVLILDECSMMDIDLFEKLNAIAKFVRQNDNPFGGLQVIACGDFFQLPPVQPHKLTHTYCFQSPQWAELFRVNIVLTRVFRQANPEFLAFLNLVRHGVKNADVEAYLRACQRRVLRTEDGIEPTILDTHRRDVDAINQQKLADLPGGTVAFKAQDEGTEPYLAQLKKHCMAKEQIHLRVGAQVMLVKNISVGEGLVNGARGVILRFSDGLPLVRFVSGLERVIGHEKWKIEIAGHVVATRKQVPLELAWALSVHKCQGLTLDRVRLSLEKVFESGMAYVALSRVRSPADMQLIDYNIDRINADKTVVEFYNQLSKSSPSVVTPRLLK